jgi:hypothetical protein
MADLLGNRFYGLDEDSDEWMDVLSPRIQSPGKMADYEIRYNKFSKQKPDEGKIDDFYDALFESEYNDKPFYAIGRSIYSKSLSYLTFVNIFV